MTGMGKVRLTSEMMRALRVTLLIASEDFLRELLYRAEG